MPIVGIDFGTTNSRVAMMVAGRPCLIPNQEGALATPSVVAFPEGGAPLVGQSAVTLAQTSPDRAVYAVNRLLGRCFDSPEPLPEKARRAIKLVPGTDRRIRIQVGPQTYAPEEVASFVLLNLKTAAEKFLRGAVREAIITVPDAFNYVEQQALCAAAGMAGLSVSRLIPSSSAAALAYGFRRTSPECVAVYDLGGGSFGTSIVEMSDGLFQVIARSGDARLGGDDFNAAIVNWLIREFSIEHIDEALVEQRIIDAADLAKRQLSAAHQTEIDLLSVSAGKPGPNHPNAVLTRETYYALTDRLLARSLDFCRRCLEDANRTEQVDRVLIVGAQARDPRVAGLLHSVFSAEPRQSVDDGVAAWGAAIQAGILEGTAKDCILLDVTAHSVGVQTWGGSFTPLIERNSTIPRRKGCVFTTVADGQTGVDIEVLQGEGHAARQNLGLGTLEFGDFAPEPAGRIQIEVWIEVDAREVISVGARDLATGRNRLLTMTPDSLSKKRRASTSEPRGVALLPEATPVKPAAGITQAEVDRLASEGRPRECAGQASSDRSTLVRLLDGLVTNTARAASALADKLTVVERQLIQQAVDAAKATGADSGLDELRSHLVAMEKAAAIIGQAMLRP